MSKKMIVLIGNYGSGKTELALNFAVQAAARGERTELLDLDMVNTYFRLTEPGRLTRMKEIRVVSPNFTNSGIDNIKLFIKNRPRSTVEHVTHTSYNINSKRGKIHLLHGDVDYSNNDMFNVDIQAFKTYMEFIDVENPSYVIIAPSHFIFKQDFSEMLDYHIRSKNDITVLYHNSNNADRKYLMGDTIVIDKNQRISEFHKNRGKYKKAGGIFCSGGGVL